MTNRVAKTSKDAWIVPLGDKVVLKRVVAESTTTGGIVLPDCVQDKLQSGKVAVVGDGHIKPDGNKLSLTVKEGDRVNFTSYCGEEIKIGREEYTLLRGSDILAIY
tara:strand:- start:15475 stop:15792 length:318 start_codon:yes stop_codon:yes gene_type:complete